MPMKSQWLRRRRVTNRTLLSQPNSSKSSTCGACLQHSCSNPLNCPFSQNDIDLQIGHGWGAILIAGSHSGDPSQANVFKADMESVYKAITSRVPLIMGIRKDCVQRVYQQSPCYGELIQPKINQAIKHLQSQRGVHTLLLYITGHHDKNGFCFGGKEIMRQEIIEKDIVENLPQLNKMIVLVDCCSPPVRDWTLREDMKIFQLSSSVPSNESWADYKGSFFTDAVVACLYGFSKPCIIKSRFDIPCVICTDNYLLAKYSDGFITTDALHEYVERHLRGIEYFGGSSCPTYYVGLSAMDTKLAFYNKMSADISLIFLDEKGYSEKRIYIPNIPDDIVAFKRSLLPECTGHIRKWAERFPEIISIFVKHGSKEDIIELCSVEDIECALYSHQQIYAGIRELDRVKQGSVGLFLPNDEADRILEQLEIADRLHRGVRIQIIARMETVRINLGEGIQKLREPIVSVDMVELQRLENIFTQLLDAEDLKGSKCYLELLFPLNKHKDSEYRCQGFFLLKLSDLDIYR